MIAGLTQALADRYRLERELGQGGMATVYLAHDLKHDRQVAIKVLRPELAAVIGAERFLSEIKTTANLQHPHILPLFDSGRTGGRADGRSDDFLFYVMPYIEGESLRDRLNREKRLPVTEAVRIAAEVAAALDYAHRHNVIHRDIKPENILLHDGSALVADFGIALAASKAGGARMTETGMSLGTPSYMSPEQAMGEREINARSDVYALGCVTYEMLSGEPPFTGPTAQSIVAKVITAEPVSLTGQRKSIPRHVEAAVFNALEKLPADRFATAAEFAEALMNSAFALRHGNGVAVKARRRTWRDRLQGSILAIAVFLLALTGWRWLRPHASGSDEVSRQRIGLWRPQLPLAFITSQSVMSPDGGAVLYVEVAGDTSRILIKERNQLDAVVLAEGEAPFFSPDGAWIGFVHQGRLQRIPRGGGAPQTIADSVRVSVPAGAWLEDGTIVFARGGRLMRVKASGGAADSASRDTLGRIEALTPLPDSRGVLVTTCVRADCAQHQVEVLDLRSGRTRVLVEDALKAWYVQTGHLVYLRSDGTVFGERFDLKALGPRGSAVPVLQGVRTFEAAGDFTISRNGAVLYVAGPAIARGSVGEVVWIGRDGKVTPVEPGWKVLPNFESGLALSPDGRLLALSLQGQGGKSDIWVKELPAGPLTRLTIADTTAERPAWTPDGRSVTFVSRLRRPAGDTSAADLADLYIRRADGSRAAELLLRRRPSVWEALWSPDAKWLLFRTDDRDPGRGDLFALAVGRDTTPEKLVATEFREVSPTLSPDGRWLAYGSDESGRVEVYVRPFPNVGDGRWQVSTEGGTEPLWSHSGREIFYINGKQELVAAEVQTRPVFAVARQHPLFSTAGQTIQVDNHRYYDISADDQRFVMIRASGLGERGAEGDLIMIQNWFPELKAKVGG
jgi:serine/threonine-protein kinase